MDRRRFMAAALAALSLPLIRVKGSPDVALPPPAASHPILALPSQTVLFESPRDVLCGEQLDFVGIALESGRKGQWIPVLLFGHMATQFDCAM